MGWGIGGGRAGWCQEQTLLIYDGQNRNANYWGL